MSRSPCVLVLAASPALAPLSACADATADLHAVDDARIPFTGDEGHCAEPGDAAETIRLHGRARAA